MERIRIRPRYNFTVPLNKQRAIQKLRDAVGKPEARINGKFVKPLVVISILDEDLHFWSPELSLDLEEMEEGTEIRCILGPRPSLWTLFATFYGFAILIGVAGLVLGFSQLTLGMSAYGFWLVPLSIVLIASAYAVALTGQRLAYDQMLLLRSFIKKTLKNKSST
jgi:hypothetical protein